MNCETPADDEAPLPRTGSPLGRILSMWVKLGLALALVGGVYFLRLPHRSTDETFFLIQDLPVLVLGGLVLAIARFAPPLPAPLAAAIRRRPRAIALGLAAIVLIVGAGAAGWVFEGYRLSLDEFMADFDAAIFAHGQLLAPIPPAWQGFAPAMQPIFGLPIPGHAFWASAYLPVNAAVRALGLSLGAEGLVGPLWSAVAVLALYAVARRLWPERPGLALGAAALLASSSQLLITAMTAYAMPAHLALNLVWLALFLRGGKLGHAGAVVVAFAACGLHQLPFHPLFAAPFVLQLWLDRRWRTATFYTLAYAAICGFWLVYWSLVLRAAGVPPEAAGTVGGGWILTRLTTLLTHLNPGAFGVMAESLVRFVTWQNPLTAPLALIAAGAAFRAKGTMRALALGVVLTLVAMMLLVPSQTHGWGYRYLHGLMGSIVLLAIWGWARLTDPLSAEARARAAGAFAAVCAVSLLVLTPLRAWQAHSYSHPYALADAAIRRAPAQVVLVDNDGLWFDQGAVVRNDPYLASGPKVMLLTALTEPQLRELCARFTVETFDGRQAAALGMETIALPPSPDAARLRAVMAGLGCGHEVFRDGG